MSESKGPDQNELPPMPDQMNRDMIDFEDLQLKDIPWTENLSLQDLEMARPFVYDDTILKIAGTHDKSRLYQSGADSLFSSYSLFVMQRERLRQSQELILINGILAVSEKKKRIELTAHIRKMNARNDENKLPRKLGRRMYEKFLDYVQYLANESGKAILHILIKQPNYEVMSDEDWNRIFLPIIEKYGYIATVWDSEGLPKHWEKTYEPQKK